MYRTPTHLDQSWTHCGDDSAHYMRDGDGKPEQSVHPFYICHECLCDRDETASFERYLPVSFV